MPAKPFSLHPALNPHGYPIPGGGVYRELMSNWGLFQKRVACILEMLDDCRSYLRYWTPAVVAPHPKAVKPNQFTVILADDPKQRGGALFVFAGNQLQLGARIDFQPFFAGLAITARRQLEPPVGTVLLGAWIDLDYMSGKRPLDAMDTLAKRCATGDALVDLEQGEYCEPATDKKSFLANYLEDRKP